MEVTYNYTSEEICRLFEAFYDITIEFPSMEGKTPGSIVYVYLGQGFGGLDWDELYYDKDLKRYFIYKGYFIDLLNQATGSSFKTE